MWPWTRAGTSLLPDQNINSGTGGIYKFNAQYQFINSFDGSTWAKPLGGWVSSVTVDPMGNLYISDSPNGRVIYASAQGQYLGEIGGFSWPSCVILDADDDIFIADNDNCFVNEFSYNSAYVQPTPTIPPTPFPSSGWGLTGTLTPPSCPAVGVAVGAGYIAVNDGNTTIHVFDSNGNSLYDIPAISYPWVWPLIPTENSISPNMEPAWWVISWAPAGLFTTTPGPAREVFRYANGSQDRRQWKLGGRR